MAWQATGVMCPMSARDFIRGDTRLTQTNDTIVVILMNRTEYVSHRKLVMLTYHVARPVSTVYKTSESMMSFILCEISLY